MNADSLSRIDGFLSSAITELFASHDIAMNPAEYRDKAVEAPFAAAIGFTSERMRGVLVLTASRALAERSLPASLRKPDAPEAILADWVGELSNQVLGRLKNRFYAAGVDIALSTPMVFAGKDLHHFSQPSPVNRRLLFEGDGLLLVEFQAEHDAGFEIGPDMPGRNEPVAPEGEALFF